MRKFLLIATLLLSQMYALQFCYEDAGWCYDVSTQQAFYIFHIDNAEFDYMGGLGGLEVGDALGAFKKDDNGDDICVGFLRIGDENQPGNGGVITLSAMGDDGSFPHYLNGPNAGDDGELGTEDDYLGDVPILKLYDASTGDVVCATTSGEEIPGWENFGIFNLHGLDDAYGDAFPESYLSGDAQECDGCIYGLDDVDEVGAEARCACQGASQ